MACATVRPHAAGEVRVAASARLHMGFFDLNGSLGRRFGSIGLALDAPLTRLALAPSARTVVEGADAERAADYLNRLIDRLGLPPGYRLTVETAIPPHAGLGSGTQL